ncbi:MAG TPA: aldolase [Alphaproteobacteria bacterium]|jgi:ribulose-5-phosphate 4-epimerase/fuculose-1-phosphate aldolase
MTTDAATLRQARIDLAAALRWAERHGFSEAICNHFSFMVPGTTDRFLINPQGRHWREITASSLLLVGDDGKLIEGDAPPEPTAYYIHWRLHRAVPQARCVLHTHMPYATALTMLEDPELLPALQTSLLFHEQVAHDPDYDGLAFDEAEGDRMASKLGNRSVLFLANHGVIVTGGTVHEAYDRLYYLERACMTQVLAMSTGKRLKMVRPDVARKTAAQMTGAVGHTQQTAHFEALKRLLDKEAPDYRH